MEARYSGGSAVMAPHPAPPKRSLTVSLTIPLAARPPASRQLASSISKLAVAIPFISISLARSRVLVCLAQDISLLLQRHLGPLLQLPDSFLPAQRAAVARCSRTLGQASAPHSRFSRARSSLCASKLAAMGDLQGRKVFKVFNQDFIVDERYTVTKEVGQGAYGIVW